MNSYVNKIMFFFSLTFVIVLILIVSSGYILSNSSFSNKDIVVETNNLKVIFDQDSESLENIIPMSYNEGLIKGNKIKIKIENTKEEKINYKVKIIDNGNNEIAFDKIYYRINNETPKLLSYNDGIIYEGQIKPFSYNDLEVKIWISDELIENSDQGKKSNLKIIIE